MTAEIVAADGEPIAVPLDGQVWMVSWHPPPAPPDGTPHSAEGICVTDDGQLVLISPNGELWGFPAGRPEDGESLEDTLRREVQEEACATVVAARLLGFSAGTCVEGHEEGLVLVRSIWRADVRVDEWEPRCEIPHRRAVGPTDAMIEAMLAANPYAPFIRRGLHEAGVAV
jgi:hypothetical protein